LRRTHLDELPQLLSILTGDMSVVGPRPERPAIDAEIDAAVAGWPRRWFVKPGLTGLAQVNDVSSVNPELKLRYDVEYIRRRSFALDVRIVLGQLRTVLTDVYRVF
jgi:lipopolysaccharide/colanic/teichoic acid biosynthesis glycosyltransferase